MDAAASGSRSAVASGPRVQRLSDVRSKNRSLPRRSVLERCSAVLVLGLSMRVVLSDRRVPSSFASETHFLQQTARNNNRYPSEMIQLCDRGSWPCQKKMMPSKLEILDDAMLSGVADNPWTALERAKTGNIEQWCVLAVATMRLRMAPEAPCHPVLNSLRFSQ